MWHNTYPYIICFTVWLFTQNILLSLISTHVAWSYSLWLFSAPLYNYVTVCLTYFWWTFELLSHHCFSFSSSVITEDFHGLVPVLSLWRDVPLTLGSNRMPSVPVCFGFLFMFSFPFGLFAYCLMNERSAISFLHGMFRHRALGLADS